MPRIRLARPDDIPAIFTIRTSVRENHLSLSQLTELGITPDSLRSMLEAQACLWVAEVDGTVAGFSMIDAEDGCLFAAFVAPQAEGRGLGRLLVETAEEALFRTHSHLWLETAATSRAAGFYRHLGWAAAGPVSPEGDLRMEKRR
ncbi:GNAT family N-acetyltransferase [Novispirillum itersonii]|uniref:GNAT superfamily N-acetyltransferase n=1 Tax=Novispirillum itersonii TaxID=189 RepID=A0A7W9ZGJ0_NOVIT|nr:GNAT family N-acetyltransferase [Novispirillum itersonii]MBB6211088.1 GNAT superfamily N-acetyltransferase [Novispirillum itersonii]